MFKPTYLDKYNHFRNLLISFRKKKGFTQNEIAQKLNKQQSFVSKYESGERRIDFVEFVEIATILQIDIKEFWDCYNKEEF